MKDGFIKVAAATPTVKVADTVFNTNACLAEAEKAAAEGVKLLVFPELALTGYSCGDLFANDVLLEGALQGLREYIYGTAMYDMVSVIGLPIAFSDKVLNCAAVVSGGQLLGLVPKSFLPNYSEQEELRVFTPAKDDNFAYVFDDNVVMLGTKQIFVCRQMPAFKLGIEICEDLFVPCPPSSRACAVGATVIANPAASLEMIGKDTFRKTQVLSQSARTLSGYIYAGIGDGESTAHGVFGGHSMIAEGGRLIAERKPFDFASGSLLISELDLQKLTVKRRSTNTFTKDFDAGFCEIEFDLEPEETELTRTINAHPFIPADKAELAEHCEKILTIQSLGLAKRMEASYSEKIVVGISGGLDSCLALLVMAKAVDHLKRPRTDIIAVTMPCFGTTARTKNNATILCEELGVDFRQVDIFDAVKQHFADIGHDMDNHNVVYENAQARERTQVLMDIANAENGLVVGTGDLSELALGWATYNGDHMSMYGVNGSIPKTLVRHVVRHYADCEMQMGELHLANALYDILNTPVSPELLPAKESGEIAQVTEDLVGPYELHDFYIYNFVKYGFSPKKLFRMAKVAFDGVYDERTILKWLEVFTKRFFAQQFKRSCLPDGPKVGSVALSGADFRMVSDVTCTIWRREVEELKLTLA